MENKKEEQMIYMKDLIFTVLRRWRAVLAVALILGILLGGMQGVSGLSAFNAPVDPAAQQAAMEQYEEEKATREQLLITAQNNFDSYERYLSEAILMRLDPYCHYEATLSLYVETDYRILPDMIYQTPNKVAEILSAYEAVVRGNTAMEAIAKTLETEPQYISELLTVTKPDTAGTLAFRMKLPSQEMAETLLPVLAEQVAGAHDMVAEAVAAHEIKVVEQSVVAKVDTDVADMQQKRQERLSLLEAAVADTQAGLATVVPPAVQTVSVKSLVKKVVIFAVLGAVVGAFLTVCVFWVLHITSDKVYGAKNLTNRTGVKVIGTLGCEKKHPVDRFVYRLEGRSTDGIATTPVVKDICCRTKDAKYVLITGSGEVADREILVKAISAAMPGVRVEDRGSLLRDAEALETLSVCDAVLLVEKTGASRYSNVKKQMDVICDYGTNLLGCVLMEN